MTLTDRFGKTFAAGIVHVPFALLLACCCSAGLLFFGVGRLIGGNPWLSLAWIAAAHSLFIAFLAAFTAMPGKSAGPRWQVALKVGLRATPGMTLLIVIALVLTFRWPAAALLCWATGTYFAVPARLVDHGWPIGRDFWRPLPVPPAHRLALMAPHLAVLALLTFMLMSAQTEGWGLFEGGIILIPAFGFLAFWASFSTALLSARFAWEGNA